MSRIREARKRKGITMKRLGEIIGFAESTVCLYETGQREPDNETLVKIANALDTSVDYLLGLDEKKEAPSSGLDDRLVDVLVSLSPDQVQRVMDFVQGLKAADKA